MPCQVPSPILPPVTGTCSDTPLSMALMWAGMSSGPSTSCTQPASAGAMRSSAVTRSVCTSGSAFSWITSEAVVCLDGLQEARDLARDLEKTFAGGFDREQRPRDGLDARAVDGGQFAQSGAVSSC